MKTKYLWDLLNLVPQTMMLGVRHLDYIFLGLIISYEGIKTKRELQARQQAGEEASLDLQSTVGILEATAFPVLVNSIISDLGARRQLARVADAGAIDLLKKDVEEEVERAGTAFSRGRFFEAGLHYRRSRKSFKELHGNLPESQLSFVRGRQRLLMGEVESVFLLGDYTRAEKLLQKVLSEDSACLSAQILRGLVEMKLRELDDDVKVIAATIETLHLDRHFTELLTKLRGFLEKPGVTESVTGISDAFNKVLQSSPDQNELFIFDAYLHDKFSQVIAQVHLAPELILWSAQSELLGIAKYRHEMLLKIYGKALLKNGNYTQAAWVFSYLLEKIEVTPNGRVEYCALLLLAALACSGLKTQMGPDTGQDFVVSPFRDDYLRVKTGILAEHPIREGQEGSILSAISKKIPRDRDKQHLKDYEDLMAILRESSVIEPATHVV